MALKEGLARLAALALAEPEEPAAESPHAPEPLPLEELPPDALGRVLELLSVADIHNLLLASRGLNLALENDNVWLGLCAARWGALTDLPRWLVPPLPPTMPGTPGRVTLPLPQTYRKLYMLLHESAPIVGLWRLVGEGARSSLISFRWARDGIEGAELEPRTPLSGKVDATLWARICPARGLTTAVAVDPDMGHATVTVYGAQGQRMHKSPSVEAAAAVALPHSQASSSPLGTSPLGSFEHEWLEFMSTSVQHGRSKQRRRSQRGMLGGPARPEGPAVYHLRRVERVQPTSRHPHSGLWLGDYGPSGIEVLHLSYSFKGKAAELEARKVTGDEFVPAGQVSWRCKAAPLRPPLAPEDAALVGQQEERWLAQWEVLLDADDSDDSDASSIAGGFAFAPPSPAAPGGRLPRSSSGAGPSEPPPPRAPARGPPRITAVHEGAGQVAGPGFDHPEWVQGRLLVHEDGSLCFVLLEGLDSVIEMRRLRMRR